MYFAQCIQDFASEYGLILSLFLGGLLGGMTHCAGMCAPFILAQTDHNGDFTLKNINGPLLLPYQLGRMVTYVFLGILLHGVMNIVFLFSDTRIWLTVPMLLTAAIVFLTSAFPMIAQIFPWAARIQSPAPMKTILNLASNLIKAPGTTQKFTLGILLGFMPCGLVIAAIMAASTAHTVIEAGLAMAAFSLGTMPSLILVALAGKAVMMRFPKSKIWLRQTAMSISVVWLFLLASIMMFNV